MCCCMTARARISSPIRRRTRRTRRRHGYSRDHRPDCVQVVIALVVTPEGLPLAYEVLAGNTRDCTTLKDFLARIERQYGKARRVWCMDRLKLTLPAQTPPRISAAHAAAATLV